MCQTVASPVGGEAGETKSQKAIVSIKCAL